MSVWQSTIKTTTCTVLALLLVACQTTGGLNRGSEKKLAAQKGCPQILSDWHDWTNQHGLQRSHIHNGIDLGSTKNYPIIASDDGEVALAGFHRRMGNRVVIYHGNKVSSLYWHMDKIKAKEGTKVKRGDVIGFVGDTGIAAENVHLHYSIYRSTKDIDSTQAVTHPYYGRILPLGKEGFYSVNPHDFWIVENGKIAPYVASRSYKSEPGLQATYPVPCENSGIGTPLTPSS